LLAQRGEYGLVTLLSGEAGVSRQTLYTWQEQGRQALEQVFSPPARGPLVTPTLTRQVLTLLVEAHASYQGLAAALAATTGQHVSVGTLVGIVTEAERRAVAWMAQHAPPGARPLALDEMYGNDRRGAYLHVVDTLSWAVWAAEGPTAVDTESWTLVLWLAQERGLRWEATVSDGGVAIEAALRAVDPDRQHGRDVWHVLHVCAQVQGRLDRAVARLVDRTAAVERQAARVAAGRRPRGHHVCADRAAHAAAVAQAQQAATNLRYLTGVLRDLLDVVVVTPTGLLDAASRACELDALVALLADLATSAPLGQRAEVERLQQHVQGALPGLLAWVGPLDDVQRDAALVLGAAGVALVAWAWQRRRVLGRTVDQLVAQLPLRWGPAARRLLTTWQRVPRASSAVENWHSILRPHLAVHRTLTPGLLALLAVWHNHRVFARGAHAGASPLQLSGMAAAPTDWLLALGYPPAEPPTVVCPPARQAA
jgi:hypothetical protein